MHPEKSNVLTCFIIGGSSLAISCSKILSQNGIAVKGLLSNFTRTVDWCKTERIPIYHDFDNFAATLHNTSYDYLFSIINPRKISQELLDTARIAGINYHDSLLPKYAGCNATTWSILNNESSHGITWHIMDEIIDNGPILEQVSLAIEAHDTALSLNLKCYQAAIKAFLNLAPKLQQTDYIAELKNKGAFPSNKKDYYAKNRKVENDGYIDWSGPAANIERLFRALYFGEYENPLTPCKIRIRDNLVLKPQELYICNESSHESPGSILAINKNNMIVSTSTENICVSSFEIESLMNQQLIGRGMILP